MSGCGALDTYLRVDDGAAADVLAAPIEDVIDRAEDAGNSIFPGAGWVLGGLLTIGAVVYRATRKKKAKGVV